MARPSTAVGPSTAVRIRTSILVGSEVVNLVIYLFLFVYFVFVQVTNWRIQHNLREADMQRSMAQVF